MDSTSVLKVLVTGANGQLGTCFRALTPVDSLEYIFADRSSIDISKAEEVNAFIENNHIDVIINCAAYTAVDKAETEQAQSKAINCDAAKTLAETSKKYDLFLIHYSTDYVYNLDIDRPLSESDDCEPLGVYAQTKYAGEQEILSINPDALIIRTSWVYSEYANNFVTTMLKLFSIKEELNVVSDQIGTPTYAPDIAVATQEIIIHHLQKLKTKGTHIYNFSNLGTTNWAAFAQAIATRVNSPIRINPIPSVEYPTPAHRPLWSVMTKSKIVETFELDIPTWQESLDTCLKKLLS